MSDTVYITVYVNQYPDDGFEIGGVYEKKSDAEEAAREQSDSKYGWENSNVREMRLR